ncbi:MAG TPA: DUF296 domain-containing protein [Candidatus Diapherotrites archaeon]|uniref:DUF296 domain-containing protein n=1 Tax=Candidatus Iainarchaeum sp. TaxID=3101447 RepID=A0A7J4JHT7_9ARCH|nr:DUF296 domain-containing protein [Candidatus Diapherotrites archaeon]HIH15955.1 DUF296 domain-containing protein [Candidatus Diapherotrites archaeon]
MPASCYFKGGQKRCLTLQLDEADNILACLEKAMTDARIGEGKIVSCAGNVREGVMNGFSQGKYVVKEIKDVPLAAASGRFVRTKQGLQGDLHILCKQGMNSFNGTLVKGTAAGGLEIKLEFVDLAGSQTF